MPSKDSQENREIRNTEQVAYSESAFKKKVDLSPNMLAMTFNVNWLNVPGERKRLLNWHVNHPLVQCIQALSLSPVSHLVAV